MKKSGAANSSEKGNTKTKTIWEGLTPGTFGEKKAVPPNFAERRRWMLKGPLKYPFALLPFAAKQGVWSVPYAAVAESMVEHLEPNGRFSRQRVGLANPQGRR